MKITKKLPEPKPIGRVAYSKPEESVQSEYTFHSSGKSDSEESVEKTNYVKYFTESVDLPGFSEYYY